MHYEEIGSAKDPNPTKQENIVQDKDYIKGPRKEISVAEQEEI
jgi:hypothetical protein